MTVEDYENQGGFKQELSTLRNAGYVVTSLQEQMQARPHREPEMLALTLLATAVDHLRSEIIKTRSLANEL